jgi:NADPH-dependent F420 reductase
MAESQYPSIAILGGTGKEGKGLAYRWARAGYTVIIGSRSPEKARVTADAIGASLGGVLVGASDYLSAAEAAEIVVIAVPYVAHRETLETIKGAMQGKLLIDVTVPLVPPKVSMVQMPPAGSAAQEARELLGDGVEIVDAFQTISHLHFTADYEADSDVLVTGSSKEARTRALDLVEAAGLTGWDAGPIENSVVVEGLTSVLIHINRRYGSTHAGIRITGVERG